MPKLSDTAVTEALATLPGWERRGDTIVKQFRFPSFADAVAYVVRLAFDAESVDHHPDLTLSYRQVTVAFSTHSEGGITPKDVDGAHSAERTAGAPPRAEG